MRAKFSAPINRWKPTRSAPSRPSMISLRHGRRANSSHGGNGMCRKNPIVASGRSSRTICRDELELVVVDPDHRAGRGDLRQAVGEPLVDGDVGVPLLGLERRLAHRVVVQRPQRVVGKALVVVVVLARRQADRVELDAVEGERLGVVVDHAGPAHPGSAGVAQHRQQRADQPARARCPGVVGGAHHRQPVGGDDERPAAWPAVTSPTRMPRRRPTSQRFPVS